MLLHWWRYHPGDLGLNNSRWQSHTTYAWHIILPEARFVSWFLKHCSRLRCQSFSCSLAQRCKTKGNAVIMSNGCNRASSWSISELQSNAIMQIPLNSTLHLVWVLLLTSKWIRWWEKNIVLANLKLSSFLTLFCCSQVHSGRHELLLATHSSFCQKLNLGGEWIKSYTATASAGRSRVHFQVPCTETACYMWKLSDDARWNSECPTFRTIT